MRNDSTVLPPLTDAQLAAEQASLARHNELVAEIDRLDAADRAANHGRPITRVIDGQIYFKQRRIIYPLPGSELSGPKIAISWGASVA